MRNWRKQREAPPSVQLRSGERHPFGVLREYVHLGRGEARLYRAVRMSACLACVGAAVGVLLAFYLTFVCSYASLSAANLLVFLLMWLVPTPLIA